MVAASSAFGESAGTIFGRLKLPMPIPTSAAPAAIDTPAMTGSTIDATSSTVRLILVAYDYGRRVASMSRATNAGRTEHREDETDDDQDTAEEFAFHCVLLAGLCKTHSCRPDILESDASAHAAWRVFAITLQFVQTHEVAGADQPAFADQMPGLRCGRPVAMSAGKGNTNGSA